MSNWKPCFCLSLYILAAGFPALGAQEASQKLEWAVENNDTAQVARILRSQPELLKASLPSGGSALGIASSLGHWETVQFLLENGADTQSRDARGDQAYLGAFRAAYRGLARLLLSRGADKLSTDSLGNTALHLISTFPESRWGEVLSGGFDLEFRNYLGQTPFMRAVYEANLTMADILAREGALSDEMDYLGRTPLDYARRQGDEGMILFLYSLR